MSNKDVRRPAPQAEKDWAQRQASILAAVRGARAVADNAAEGAEAAKQTVKQDAKPAAKPAARDPDMAFLDSLSPGDLKRWVEHGESVKRHLQAHFPLKDGAMTDDVATDCLDICTRFLAQLVEITSHLLQTIDVTSLRELVASEMPLPHGLRAGLAAAGIVLPVPKADETPEPDPNWRKRPRGGRHPLMVLIQFAMQAARLLQKITAGTNPNAQNLLTLEEREERELLRAWRGGLPKPPEL